MIFDNQLRHATTIIRSYQGEIPLHAWLKDFFREHTQMGSRDRRLLSGLAYSYYRLGHALKDHPIEDRMLTGWFFSTDQPTAFLQYFRPEWDPAITRTLEEKITMVRESIPSFDPTDIFPWKEELSDSVDHYSFCLSFLRQPDLFLRIRPGYQAMAVNKTSDVHGEFIAPFTLRLPNRTKVEDLFTVDKEVVVQDYSSQRLAWFLDPDSPYLLPPASGAAAFSVSPSQIAARSSKLSFWDACAASGGKSILAFDLMPGLDITVSDIRDSVLQNLRRRFRVAGIKDYKSFVSDLTRDDPAFLSPSRQSSSSGAPNSSLELAACGLKLPFDLVLTDVPCTGSGTWSRTPEQLYFFDPARIVHYREQQAKILSRIVPRLSKGARLVYSTCSVFKKENEEMAGFIGSLAGIQPDRFELIKGFDIRADSLFAASFKF